MRLPDFSDMRGKHLLVALSGGADSMALLTLLCRARDKGMLGVSAAHYEHGIRGEESREDARFCKNVCDELNVPFYTGHADVPEIARRTGEGCETVARKLRYKFLNEVSALVDADFIALAHHMDDQAETVLMHILRGAGPDGISGMRGISGKLYRPLLGIRKREIIEFLTENGISWREDKTNAVSDNPRNALRNEILPKLDEIYNGASAALARYSKYAAIENDYMSRVTEDWRKAHEKKIPFGYALDLTDGDEAIIRRAIRAIVGRDLTGAKLDEIISLEKNCDIVNGMRAEMCGKTLYIINPHENGVPVYFNIEGENRLEGICRVTCAPCANEPEKVLKSVQNVSRKAIEGCCLRTRMDRDYIIPYGMSGRKSLSDYFTDKKIDRPLRDFIPLIAKGNEILWACGVGISQNAALDGSDAVRITCEYEGWEGIDP